jgi:hypothetical protein
VVTATDRLEQLKIPYHALADAMEMGIKVMGNSYLTTGRLARSKQGRRAACQAGAGAGEALAEGAKNRREVQRIYNRYIPSSDPAFMDHWYQKNVEPIPVYPYTISTTCVFFSLT